MQKICLLIHNITKQTCHQVHSCYLLREKHMGNCGQQKGICRAGVSSSWETNLNDHGAREQKIGLKALCSFKLTFKHLHPYLTLYLALQEKMLSHEVFSQKLLRVWFASVLFVVLGTNPYLSVSRHNWRMNGELLEAVLTPWLTV